MEKRDYTPHRSICRAVKKITGRDVRFIIFFFFNFVRDITTRIYNFIFL